MWVKIQQPQNKSWDYFERLATRLHQILGIGLNTYYLFVHLLFLQMFECYQWCQARSCSQICQLIQIFSMYFVFMYTLTLCFVVVPIHCIHSILNFIISCVEETFIYCIFLQNSASFSIKRSGYCGQQSPPNDYCLKWSMTLNNSKIPKFYIRTVISLVPTIHQKQS